MLKKYKHTLIGVTVIIFIYFLFNENPLRHIMYHFSNEWVDENKVELLEDKALDGDCNSAKELAYHYKKANFGYRFDSKGFAWLMFSESILCGHNEDDIYDLTNYKVYTTIRLFVKGNDDLENNIPKMHKKLKNYFMHFPDSHPCHLSIMRTTKTFGEKCMEISDKAILDNISDVTEAAKKFSKND